MAQGRSNAAIAGTLVISAGVVEKHVASHPLAQVTAHGEDFGQAFDRTASPDILRYVPKYSGLDQIFHALGDSSRRAMVERLSRGPASVSELAKPFPVALPTVVQHLGVLEKAGIVTSAKAGRVRTCQLVPGALDPAADWIGQNVAIAGGGTLLRQVIRLGLLDELELHIVPVILGDGMRLLSPELGLDDKEGIELAPARVIATPDVTHIRYKVNGRSPLVLDNRGRDGEPAVT